MNKSSRKVTIIFYFLFFYSLFIFSCATDDDVKEITTNNNFKEEDKGDFIQIETEGSNDESSTKTLKEFQNSFGMQFIEIPAGEFMMGCTNEDTECFEDEKPLHKIKISKSFYLGKYEITQGQWKAVMGRNPSHFSNCGDSCPVEMVSNNEVQKFIKELCKKENLTPCKYRLPTEAEWEYSAKAGSTTKYYWGDTINEEYLWFNGNSRNTIHPVGKKKPNQWGLYDMVGNVNEWVNDWYGEDYYVKSLQIDPLGKKKGDYKVLRGCSWHSNSSICRSSNRTAINPENLDNDYGFRLLRSSN